jgi:hypothetical protein
MIYKTHPGINQRSSGYIEEEPVNLELRQLSKWEDRIVRMAIAALLAIGAAAFIPWPTLAEMWRGL